MSSLFWRQFKALFLKNWIILAKHPIVSLNTASVHIYIILNSIDQLTIFRCFVIPVAVAIFLAYAQVFLTKPNSASCSLSALFRHIDMSFSCREVSGRQCQ